MLEILFTLLIFVISGWGFALPALLPPFRRKARSSPISRDLITLGLGWLTFGSNLLVLIYVLSFISAWVLSFDGADGSWRYEVVLEIQHRLITPPALSPSCYTGETICRRVNQRYPQMGFNYGILTFSAIIAFGSTVANVYFVRRFTRTAVIKAYQLHPAYTR